MTFRMCLRIRYSALGWDATISLKGFVWIEYGGGFVCVCVVGIMYYVDSKQC